MNNGDRVRVQTRFVAVLTLACFAPVAVGCVSHEYVIPKQELQRLVEIPPHERGQSVYVIQDVGSRRANAIDADPASWQRDTNAEIYFDGYVELPHPGDVTTLHGRRQGTGRVPWRAGSGGGSAPDGGRTPAAGGNWRATGGGGSSPGGGWRAAGGGGSSSGSGWRAPSGGGGSPSGGGGGSSSGGGWRMPSSGGSSGGSGGNGSAEALIVVAVVLVAVAAVVAVGLVGSEGVRYDGLAEMWPGQPVYLKDQRGGESVVALGDLTPEHVAATVEAKVKDDEGYGLLLRGHRVIDRDLALVFKLDAGSLVVDDGGHLASGLTVSAKAGLFVRPWLGLLLTATTGSSLGGVAPTVSRHSLGFEVQSLPLRLGMFHFGGYGHIGAGAVELMPSQAGAPIETATIVGGGALAEYDVTGRMALTLRAGINNFYYVDTGFASPAATFTAGVAIY